MKPEHRKSRSPRKLKWAVIGIGVAGRARCKAVQDDPRATLWRVWRGRHAEEAGAPLAPSLEEAIARVDAVAICSPTAFHAEQVRMALEAGRHVVVEFPLAEDAATATALFRLAEQAGRILHEEHIELLDPPSATLSAHVTDLSIRSVAVSFDGPGSSEAGAGELALKNVARLHRVVSLGGPFGRIDVVSAEPGRLTAELALRSGAPVRVTFQQAPYYVRNTTLAVETVNGLWEQHGDQLFRDSAPVTLVGSGGLFSRDQRFASARILDGAPPYVSEEMLLHVMTVVDRLGRLEPGPL